MPTVASLNVDISADTSGVEQGVSRTTSLFSQLRSAAGMAGAGMNAYTGAAGKASSATQQFAQAANVSGAKAAALHNSVTQLSGATTAAGASAARAAPSFLEMSSAVTAGTVAAHALMGVASQVTGTLLNIGKGALELSSQLQQAQIGFETMLGTGEAAQKFIGQLQSFAERTAFNFPGIQQVAQSFLAMGIDAKNVIPIIDDFSNALSAAGHGGDTERLQRIGMSLSEIAAQGKLSGEQIRELSRNGIAVLPLLAEAFGTTEAKIKEMAKNNQISSKMFFEAFHTEAALHYGDIQERQAQTWAVAISNVQDILGRMTTTTLDEFFQMMTKGALAVQDFLNSNAARQWAADLKASIHEVMAAAAPLGELFMRTLGVKPRAPVPPRPAIAPVGGGEDGEGIKKATTVPAEAIASAAAYKVQIAEGTAEVHRLTEQLNGLKTKQDEVKQQIDDTQRTYELRLRGMKDQQEAVNASIEGTKTRYEAILAPLTRAQDQLSRLAEDTKTEFAAILDPLKESLDQVNRQTEDTKAHFAEIAEPLQEALDATKNQIDDIKISYENVITPIELQIEAIDKANSALTKQRNLTLEIADVGLRQKQLAALGDPGQRANIAGQLKMLDLNRDDLERQKQLADLGKKKKDDDKAGEGIQKQLDANTRERLRLEQQLSDASNKGLLAEVASQEVLNGAQRDSLRIQQDQQDIAAQQAKGPLEDQLGTLEAQQRAALDPLISQQKTLGAQLQDNARAEAAALKPLAQQRAALTREIEDTARAEEAAMKIIATAQAEVKRTIEDVQQSQKDALAPLEAQQKAIAAQIKETEAAERAALQPLKDRLAELDRESNILEAQKRQQADKVQGYKDETAEIKARNAEAAGGAGGSEFDLTGGVEPPAAPPPLEGHSLIAPETIATIHNAAEAIDHLHANIDAFFASPGMQGLGANLRSIGDELGKLIEKATGGKGLNLAEFLDLDRLVLFGSKVAGVVANILDTLNTLAEVANQVGVGLRRLFDSFGMLASGDIFGAQAALKESGEAFAAIPKLIADEQARAKARMAGETPAFAEIARNQFGGVVTATNEALQPMAPTVEQNLAAAQAQFPAIAQAVQAEQGPMGIAATGLGEALTVPLGEWTTTAVADTATTLPGVPQAVTDQHAVMTSAAGQLGTNLVDPLTNLGLKPAVANANKTLPEVPAAVVAQQTPMLTEATTLGGNLPKGIDAGVDGGKAQTDKNIGDWVMGLVKFFDPLADALNRIADAISRMPSQLPDWMTRNLLAGLPGGGGTGPRVNIPGGSGGGNMDLTAGNPGQFEIGLSASDAAAACGPYAALLFFNHVGRFPSGQEALEMARKNGWSQAGMGGIGNLLRTLTSEGLSAAIQEPTIENIRNALKANSPVAISTPRHYFGVTGINEDDTLEVGGTGTVLAGGKTRMSLAEIERLGRLEGQTSNSLQGIVVLTQQLGEAVQIAGAKATAGVTTIMAPIRSAGVGLAQSLAQGIAQGDAVVGDAVETIVNESIKQGMDPLITLALAKAESGFDPKARGDHGASVGLFQLHERGQGAGMTVAQREDPATNVAKFLPAHKALYDQLVAEGHVGEDLAATFGRLAEQSDPQFAYRYADAYRQLVAQFGTARTNALAAAQSNNTLNASNTALGASTNTVGQDLQYNTQWVAQMADQQSRLAQVLSGQVNPAEIQTSTAMQNLSAVLGPVERQVAGGAISMDTLQFKLVELARATGLAAAPWRDYNAGLIDINEAMMRVVSQSADAGPQFEALRQSLGTTNAITDEGALKWLQYAINFGKATPAIAANTQATAAATTATTSLNTATGTVNDTINPDIYTQTAGTVNKLTGALGTGASAFGEIGSAASGAQEQLDHFSQGAHELADFLDGHTFHVQIEVDPYPSEFEPGSPTPFEMGLRGIARAEGLLNRIHLRGLKDVELPRSDAAMQDVASRNGSGGGSRTEINHYDVTVPGFMGTKQELIDAMHEGLLIKKRKNRRLGLGDND